ncbi:MAG TPA: aldose epimerase family protein, partial [Fimbriimonas sp.]|nr:aldose epimerase family protein [Fimbriimonas sp.]
MRLFTLKNSTGAHAKIADYGGVIAELHMPDRNGNLTDVVMGYDNLDGYSQPGPYLGAVIGRVANRISEGKFRLDGEDYSLAINNGPNSLHGGLQGYDKRVWKAEQLDDQMVRLTLSDPDGTEGYPGTVDVSVVYTFTDDNTLRIEYEATTDKATPINLTNHAYFNLKDGGKTDILDHLLQVEADLYTPGNEHLVPTGEILSVAGTPIDFRRMKPIGRDLRAMGGDPVGYDCNLVLR